MRALRLADERLAACGPVTLALTFAFSLCLLTGASSVERLAQGRSGTVPSNQFDTDEATLNPQTDSQPTKTRAANFSRPQIESSQFQNTDTTTSVTNSKSQFLHTTAASEEQDADSDGGTAGGVSGDASSCADLPAFELTKAENLTDNARLVDLQSCLRRKMKQQVKGATRFALEMFERLDLSGGCSASLMNLASSLSEIKSFAFKSKIPSGVMKGLLSDFGDFDQCMSIRSRPEVPLELEIEESGAYSGKYCLMSVKMDYRVVLGPNSAAPDGIEPDGLLWDELVRNYWTSSSPKGFQVGVCVSSRCSDEDLDKLYKFMAKRYNLVGELMSCQSSLELKRQHQPDPVQVSIINCLQLLLALALLGTLLEFYALPKQQTSGENTPQDRKLTRLARYRRTTQSCLSVLSCFSLVTSWHTFRHGRSPAWRRAAISACKTNSGCYTDDTKLPTKFDPASNNADQVRPISGPKHNPFRSSANRSPFLRTQQPTIAVYFPPLALSSKQPLAHLAGLRLFVMLWITMGHSFLYPSANNYQYFRSIINMAFTRDSIWFAATNFTLGIDMLLYITGFAFVYKLPLAEMEARYASGEQPPVLHLSINPLAGPKLVAYKILRLWPTYLALIALAIVAPLLSDGPMWPEMVARRVGASCRENWWTNVLFINNLWPEAQICLPSSWFISILMQLFIVGCLVIALVREFSITKRLLVLACLTFAACTLSFYLAYQSQIQAPAIRMDESFIMEMDASVFAMYTNLFNNLGPFLVGMAGGFWLLQCQLSRHNSLATDLSTPTVVAVGGCNLSSANKAHEAQTHNSMCLRRLVSSSLFHLAASLIVAIVAVAVLSSVFITDYSRLGAAVYWSLHRVGWALVTGFVVHNCATGSWRLLDRALALSAMKPFGRLIFIAYLVHPVLIHIHSGLVRDGLHVSVYNMLNIYTTRLVMTFTLALCVYLLVELPFLSLQQTLTEYICSKHQEPRVTPTVVSPEIVIDSKQSNEPSTNQEQTTLN